MAQAIKTGSPIDWPRWPVIALWGLYAVMWVGGVGSHFVDGHAPADAAWAAPVFLALAGALALVEAGWRERFVLVTAAFLGVVAEVIGVHTGLIFSGYVYTDALGPRLWGVPLVMASAWMVLVAYVREMLASRRLPGWFGIICGAMWMTAIDLVIDPLAAGPLAYWRWSESGLYYGIPARNFCGWFAISLVILALVRGFGERERCPNHSAQTVGASIILFFTLIALAHHLMLAVIIGAALCAFHLYFSFHRKQAESTR
jgi:bisanhydrobacterioruberin hydratase